MKAVFTDKAPKPAGHYSQGIIHNGLIYISGQLAVDPNTGEKKLSSIQDQTKQALENLNAVLEAAGSNKNLVIKATVYVSDINLWDEVNTVYAKFFGSHKPARAIVPTKDLHYGFKVEIDAIAAIPN